MLTGETGESFGGARAAAEDDEEGVVGRAASEEGVVGRADSEEGVVGRAADEEDGVGGRAEEEEDEGVVGRAPGLGGGGVGAFLDRKGEMLDLCDLEAISQWELMQQISTLFLSL